MHQIKHSPVKTEPRHITESSRMDHVTIQLSLCCSFHGVAAFAYAFTLIHGRINLAAIARA